MTNSEPRAELARRIAELETLASPPASLDRILSLAGDPESRVASLADAIELDPAITARVLRLANSAYYGFSRRVETVPEAIMVIGFRSVRNLATCAAVAPVFAKDESSLDLRSIWIHSCAVAEAARLIAASHSDDDGFAYVTGLLHDLGQVALAELDGPDYVQSVEQSSASGGLCARERDALGADHAWVGAELCQHWQLPERIHVAIAGHHDPSPENAEAARLRIAEHLADALGFVDPRDAPAGDPQLPLEKAGLKPADLERLGGEMEERREGIEVIFHEVRR